MANRERIRQSGYYHLLVDTYVKLSISALLRLMDNRIDVSNTNITSHLIINNWLILSPSSYAAKKMLEGLGPPIGFMMRLKSPHYITFMQSRIPIQSPESGVFSTLRIFAYSDSLALPSRSRSRNSYRIAYTSAIQETCTRAVLSRKSDVDTAFLPISAMIGHLWDRSSCTSYQSI